MIKHSVFALTAIALITAIGFANVTSCDPSTGRLITDNQGYVSPPPEEANPQANLVDESQSIDE